MHILIFSIFCSLTITITLIYYFIFQKKKNNEEAGSVV